MNIETSVIIDKFFLTYTKIFTIDEFYKFVKSEGGKITKAQARNMLDTSDMVFSLINNEYITRAGVFIGRWFSFKPSKEEIQKKHIILGHRCMPFINPEISPDRISVINNKYIVSPQAVSFSMNLALDTFALYGEGYVLPYIFNDHSNTSTPLSSVQYGMPNEIQLTAWPINQIIGGSTLKYGDRILGRVVNWEENIVELTVLKVDSSSSISEADIEREEWYTDFENGLIQSFENSGPADSIEQQLAFLFLENQEQLCKQSCGSTEEFLKHTKKIGFAPYGVESRIWYINQTVPYVGKWNKDYSADALFNNMSMIFSPGIIDAYIENYLVDVREKNSKKTLEELENEIFPPIIKMTSTERKLVLLNIEKRHDILNKVYNQFADYKLLPIRQRVIDLFSRVSYLLCSIGCSGVKLEDFPQQELVILVQLFSHIARIVEEMENDFLKEVFPYDDVELSLDGMEETFEEIEGTLHRSLEAITYKNIKIVE